MKMKARLKQCRSLLYSIPFLFLIFAETFPGYRLADDAALDTICQGTASTDPRVCVIGIDDAAMTAYGSLESWDRDRLAELITLLTEDPEQAPAVIAVDIGIYEKKEEAADRKLAEAVKKAGNVVLVSSASFGCVAGEGESRESVSEEVISLREPFPELAEAAAAVGHGTISLDGDGYARHALGSLAVQGRKVSSLAYEAADLYLGGADPAFDTRGGSYHIRYTGTVGDYCKAAGNEVSFQKVLERKIPVESFCGKIVLIGVTAAGTQDRYYTVAAQGKLMQGVEIQANITAQILSGKYFTEPDMQSRCLLIFACTLLASLILYYCDFQTGTFLSVLSSVIYVVLVRAFYRVSYIVLPVISPILALLLPCLIRAVLQYRYVTEEKQSLVKKFSRYLPQSIAQEVAARAAEAETENLFPGEKKQVAVMFVDIRGYTALTENMEPEQAAGIINSFLTVTTEAIFRQEGTVDKFIGDCTMALFNAPLDLENYIFRAVCAALEIVEKCSLIMVDPARPELRLEVGIGIDCGETIVGNVGTPYRMEYTAIGDTVNTACRIEGRAGSGEILVSSAVYKAICHRVRCRSRGTTVLKGKSTPVRIWQVTGLVPEEE